MSRDPSGSKNCLPRAGKRIFLDRGKLPVKDSFHCRRSFHSRFGGSVLTRLSSRSAGILDENASGDVAGFSGRPMASRWGILVASVIGGSGISYAD